MSRYINVGDLHNVVMKRKAEYGRLATLIDNIVEEMVYETPTADVVERKKYDLLQSEYETLKHQLEESWGRIDELDKLNGNMRDKINKAIKEIHEIINSSKLPTVDICNKYSDGLQDCLEVLKRNLEDSNK